MDLQTVITEHTELDALSHRLERVRRDTLRVNAIAEGTITPPTAYVNRALSRLHEDRAMLTVHMPVITARIAALPASDQDEQVAQALRPPHPGNRTGTPGDRTPAPPPRQVTTAHEAGMATTPTAPPTVTSTDLTVVAHPRAVGLRLHSAAVELRVDAEDADSIASNIDDQVTSSTAGHITITFDADRSIEVATAEAKRLAIELHHAAADSRRLSLTHLLTGRFGADLTRTVPATSEPGIDRDKLYETISNAATLESALDASTVLLRSGETLPHLLHAIWCS